MSGKTLAAGLVTFKGKASPLIALGLLVTFPLVCS